MKHTSTQQVRVLPRLCLGLFLTIFSMMLSSTSRAHNVLYFDPPCFTQGTTVSVPVMVANAAGGSYFHWQFRVPGGTWQWMNSSPTTTTINGRAFLVSNGKFKSPNNPDYPSGGSYLAPALSIANSGSGTYTNQLDGVELRLLMTDGLDPQTNPGVDIWGGEGHLNPTEGKIIRLNSKPANEACYTNCTGNRLISDPANPSLTTYYGGFEIGSGNQTLNFSTPNGSTGVTTSAATDLNRWNGGSVTNTTWYRVINNPDSMNTAFDGIAPHSGRQMMVINKLSSNSSRVWQRTIAVSNTNNFFNTELTFKAWFSKVDGGTNPAVSLEVKGAATTTGTPVIFTGSTISTTVTGTSGNWVQLTLSITLPVNTYKKLQFGIRANTNSTISFALDDICLLEPAQAIMPLIMTPLKGAYSNGVSHLTWSSLQESNSNFFEIERSNDGVNYTAIGKVAAKGISDKQTNYSFNDVKVGSGNNYYRLRAVDKDGMFRNSNIVMLDVKISGTQVTGIFPNPFIEKVNIAVSSDAAGQATIRLFDNTGKLIATQQKNINKGANNVTLDNLGALAKGFYIIKVQIGDDVITQKLVK